jgi:hypothetical protein
MGKSTKAVVAATIWDEIRELIDRIVRSGHWVGRKGGMGKSSKAVVAATIWDEIRELIDRIVRTGHWVGRKEGMGKKQGSGCSYNMRRNKGAYV